MNDKKNHIDVANHYGNIRFAMFTVHVTILGSMISFAHTNKENILCDHIMHILVSSAGLSLAIFFGLSQWRISDLVQFYQEQAFTQRALLEPKSHECWVYLAKISMLLPYIFTLLYWIVYFFAG